MDLVLLQYRPYQIQLRISIGSSRKLLSWLDCVIWFNQLCKAEYIGEQKNKKTTACFAQERILLKDLFCYSYLPELVVFRAELGLSLTSTTGLKATRKFFPTSSSRTVLPSIPVSLLIPLWFCYLLYFTTPNKCKHMFIPSIKYIKHK